MTEFKQGETVLVSNDNKEWYTRIYEGMLNDVHYCRDWAMNNLVHWKYIKKVRPDIKEGTLVIAWGKNKAFAKYAKFIRFNADDKAVVKTGPLWDEVAFKQVEVVKGD